MKENKSMSKAKTESENCCRAIKEPVCIESKRQKAEIQSRMFQFNHTKINRNKKR